MAKTPASSSSAPILNSSDGPAASENPLYHYQDPTLLGPSGSAKEPIAAQRRAAKILLHECQAQDPEALARFARHIKKSDQPTLRRCQHVIAREAGAKSWNGLLETHGKATTSVELLPIGHRVILRPGIHQHIVTQLTHLRSNLAGIAGYEKLVELIKAIEDTWKSGGSLLSDPTFRDPLIMALRLQAFSKEEINDLLLYVEKLPTVIVLQDWEEDAWSQAVIKLVHSRRALVIGPTMSGKTRMLGDALRMSALKGDILAHPRGGSTGAVPLVTISHFPVHRVDQEQAAQEVGNLASKIAAKIKPSPSSNDHRHFATTYDDSESPLAPVPGEPALPWNTAALSITEHLEACREASPATLIVADEVPADGTPVWKFLAGRDRQTVWWAASQGPIDKLWTDTNSPAMAACEAADLVILCPRAVHPRGHGIPARFTADDILSHLDCQRSEDTFWVDAAKAHVRRFLSQHTGALTGSAWLTIYDRTLTSEEDHARLTTLNEVLVKLAHRRSSPS